MTDNPDPHAQALKRAQRAAEQAENHAARAKKSRDCAKRARNAAASGCLPILTLIVSILSFGAAAVAVIVAVNQLKNSVADVRLWVATEMTNRVFGALDTFRATATTGSFTGFNEDLDFKKAVEVENTIDWEARESLNDVYRQLLRSRKLAQRFDDEVVTTEFSELLNLACRTFKSYDGAISYIRFSAGAENSASANDFIMELEKCT